MLYAALRLILTLTIGGVGILGFSTLIGRFLNTPVLAFSADYDLWLADMIFGQTRQLTLNGGRAEDDQPTWSPDGTQLAFMTVRRQPFNARLPNSDLALLNLTHGAVSVLRSMPSWEDAPAWSPDGTSIAFSEKGVGAGGTSIYVLDIALNTAMVRYVSPRRNDVSATWSSDATALIIHGESDTGGVVVMRVNVQTGNTEILLPRTAYRPRLSPDTVTLAAWIPAFEGYALAVWQAGMTAPRPLTQSYPNPLPFIWAQDGMLTLSVRGETGGGLLLRIDPNTGEQTPFFRFPNRINGIAWRP